MERHRKLDVASCAPALILVLLCVVLFPTFCCAQTSAGHDAYIKSLVDQQKWREIVEELERAPQRSGDDDYYLGTALAKLQRWDDARRAFLDGVRLAPHDPRFLIELAGVAFKEKRYADAARWLRRGLRINPSDRYAIDFLATVYFLQGNLEGALKYWNKMGKPWIADVNTASGLRVSPGLLDRAFAFSSGNALSLPDFMTSKTRVQGLEIFPNYRYDLEAREDGSFDLDFGARELNGFGENKWEALLSAFRGLPYATVYVDYYNLAHSATNATAMLRWDDQKRRANLRFSGPLQSNPKYRWQLGADVRSELWALRPSFSAPPFGALNLRRQAAAGSLTAFVSGRFIWSLAAEISHRSFENAVVPNLLTPFRVNAYEIKQTASLKYLAWRMPEYRWSVSTGVSAESGALLGSPKNGFEKLQASAEWHWQPQMAGDDYAVREQVRVGKTFGQIPFDELFMLGLERDNDLWLRAHIGTRSGAKGSAPLGRNYFLSNGEIDKSVYTNGFLGVKLSPFLDIGKITDAVKVLGSHEWLVDAGVQLKFSLLGVGVTFTYGKDLRTGNNAFYATTER